VEPSKKEQKQTDNREREKNGLCPECDQPRKNHAETPKADQRVSQNPSTPTIIKTASRTLNSHRLFPPIDNKVRAKLSRTSGEMLGPLFQSAQELEGKYSADWESQTIVERAGSSSAKWKDMVGFQYDAWYEATVALNNARRKYFEGCIKVARESYEDGRITQSELEAILSKAGQYQAEVSSHDVTLKSKQKVLRGSFLDAYLVNSFADMAFVDMLVQWYREPYGATEWFKHKRDPKEQERFRKKLIKHYESDDNKFLWCPIARSFLREQAVAAAHVVPYNTGEAMCDYMFGAAENRADGHFMSPQNGLIIHREFEQALDGGLIIIVPADEGDIDPETREPVNFAKDAEPLKIRVLDQEMKKNLPVTLGPVRFAWLDGRILEFRNDERPKKRYLWYNALLALARRRRCAVPGWHEDKAALGKRN
jgi:hypothetical protein